jgi:predicted nucleotidyltransferase
VRRLSDVGIIRRIVRGRQVYYQANPECPVFEELRSLVVKTAGVAEVLRAALTPLADRVAVAFVYGSMASGKERRGSDVDILVIGDVTFSETVQALGRTQETLRREINPTVYPSREFRAKLRKGHHFLKAVLEEEKIFLIGNVRELARLVGKRLAD